MALGCINELSRGNVVATTDEDLTRAKSNPDEALVFIHGFNNSFEDALRRAGQLAYDLRFDGPVFAFSWSSEGSFLG
jgi:esterase/lipase superfamily enzyme